MKRYAVFDYDMYECQGGIYDICASFDSIQEGIEYIERRWKRDIDEIKKVIDKQGWTTYIFDFDEREIVLNLNGL